MYSYEPFMFHNVYPQGHPVSDAPCAFHKVYPFDSFFEEAKLMEKEKELMLSYLPDEYRKMQEKVDETCDRMEYEGSRMYDEYPDGGVIRQIAKKILKQLKLENDEKPRGQRMQEDSNEIFELVDEKTERYQEDIVCCFLCNEMFRRRYRSWKSKKYIR